MNDDVVNHNGLESEADELVKKMAMPQMLIEVTLSPKSSLMLV
jgi:hypothetical protein